MYVCVCLFCFVGFCGIFLVTWKDTEKLHLEIVFQKLHSFF